MYFSLNYMPSWASLVTQEVKDLPAMRETWDRSLVGKIHWRSEWQPNPVFLPGESHEQRSVAGYSPWGHIELETTERLSTNVFYIYLFLT